MTPSQNQNSQEKNDQQNKKIPYHFGEKLRSVREHKGYTLKVVAQKAGVSESLVSQIERNHVSPAIDTLLALADVLDINLEFLFEEYRKERPVTVIRSDERPSMFEDDIIYEELARPADSAKESSFESYMYLLTICRTRLYRLPLRELNLPKGTPQLLYKKQILLHTITYYFSMIITSKSQYSNTVP